MAPLATCLSVLCWGRGHPPTTAIWTLLALAGLLAGVGLYTQLRKDGQVQPATHQ